MSAGNKPYFSPDGNPSDYKYQWSRNLRVLSGQVVKYLSKTEYVVRAGNGRDKNDPSITIQNAYVPNKPIESKLSAVTLACPNQSLQLDDGKECCATHSHLNAIENYELNEGFRRLHVNTENADHLNYAKEIIMGFIKITPSSKEEKVALLQDLLNHFNEQ